MSRAFLLLSLVVLCAGASFPVGPLLSWKEPQAAGGGPTALLYLHAEGTGTQSGWTNQGVVDWDEATQVYTGTGNYGGTNSFEATDSAAARYTYTSFPIGPRTNVTVTFAVRRNTMSTTQRDVLILQMQGTNRFNISVATGGFRLTHGSVQHVLGAASSAAGNTWYGVRASYERGSGANGRMSLQWATNSFAFSTGWTNEWADGSAVTTVDSIIVGHPAGLSGNAFFYDDLVVWDGYDAVGDNPAAPP